MMVEEAHSRTGGASIHPLNHRGDGGYHPPPTVYHIPGDIIPEPKIPSQGVWCIRCHTWCTVGDAYRSLGFPLETGSCERAIGRR